MKWETSDRGKKVIKEITDAAKKSENLYLATDPDREGEAIAWHVEKLLRDNASLSKLNIYRVTFNEITKNAVLDSLKEPREIDKNLVNACANITGGGIGDNIKRVIPKGLTAEINLKNIKIKKIFRWLKNNNINDSELLKTFNCGVGFCLIIDPKNLNKVKKIFSKDYEPYVIGKIISHNKKSKVNGKINWK